ncbi:MAG: FAD-containing monooxygenase EthA [Haliea sp.]|uniref:flavin-containing monooxygenase n=1 Tax=Haliea sp. TaxID=1932666 RepID=UPI000C6BAA8D|nr:NAD(P)/FAD-dependent oxidoreductase [Haliea sp.]MBM70036.1 FAD-containing monooxygenase EthA [Haliea sp.]|tara:strand:+ start:66098 stop:67612 length:1515 start_codon:yes stop_codon:yes gene_type:complete
MRASNSGHSADVIIVGAGLSGIGAAVHLQTLCPGRRVILLESRPRVGGTWDLFRYPGIRSDSDMHTLGYDFKPWVHERAIADGASILEYINSAADEYAVREHIHFQHTVLRARFSTETARWTLDVAVTDEQGAVREECFSCQFLLLCSGYFNYAQGHAPAFPEQDRFRGTLVHPQHWPQDLDYRNKRVVIIGSGATAMTLVPALARDAAHVTMLQRSPTYVISRPNRDKLANLLRRCLPERWAYAITRWKNTMLQQWVYRKSRTQPEQVKAQLLKMLRKSLGPDFDIEKHFTPAYNPWDQRLCLVPDGDLYAALRSGRADIVTDHIDRFTETGIRLQSGETLEADIIVTATGLQLLVMGGITFEVDGKAVDFGACWTWRGMLFSGVPNMAHTYGYINASWTLRADLTARFVGRLLNHMDRRGVAQVTPTLRPADKDMPARPWLDDFSAGYIQRALHLLPKQGDRDPWRNSQDYRRDRKTLLNAPLDDGSLVFSNPTHAALDKTG